MSFCSARSSTLLLPVPSLPDALPLVRPLSAPCQAGSKLILINAFVGAHTAAQQLVSEHLAQLFTAGAAAAATDGKPALSNNDTRNSPADSAVYDVGAMSHASASAAAAASGGSRASQQQQQGAEPDGELQAARLVLQESKDEVAAALQYAHEVSSMHRQAVVRRAAAAGSCKCHLWLVVLDGVGVGQPRMPEHRIAREPGATAGVSEAVRG